MLGVSVCLREEVMLTLCGRSARSEGGTVWHTEGQGKAAASPEGYKYRRSFSCSEESWGEAAAEVGLAQSVKSPLPHSGAGTVS